MAKRSLLSERPSQYTAEEKYFHESTTAVSWPTV